MKPAVQDPERGVVVARDDDQLMVRVDTGVEPREESVLGDGGCDDVPRQPVQSFPHALPRLDVPPPVEAIGFAPIPLSHRVDVFLGVLERGLVQGSFLRLHRPAEIDDPLVGGAAGDRHTVHPRLVAPGVEDRAAAGRPLQSTAGRSTPDGVGRD